MRIALVVVAVLIVAAGLQLAPPRCARISRDGNGVYQRERDAGNGGTDACHDASAPGRSPSPHANALRYGQA